MLDRTIEEFYKIFEIQPVIRKGQTYMTGDLRLAQIKAEEDMYPKLYDYTYLRLLAYISQNQEYEKFELPSVGSKRLKEFILEWYIRNRLNLNPSRIREIVSSPMNIEVI